MTVIFTRTVKQDLALAKRQRSLPHRADKIPLVGIDHLPEIVCLSLGHKVFVKFKVVDRDDLGNDKEIVDLMTIIFQSFRCIYALSIAPNGKKFNKIHRFFQKIFLLFFATDFPCAKRLQAL